MIARYQKSFDIIIIPIFLDELEVGSIRKLENFLVLIQAKRLNIPVCFGEDNNVLSKVIIEIVRHPHFVIATDLLVGVFNVAFNFSLLNRAICFASRRNKAIINGLFSC